MMDPTCKESESEEMSGDCKYPDRASSEEGQIKTCADCGTSKTPLWRGGPAGPKTLCNACGIRNRKKRRPIVSGSKEEKRSKRRMMNNQSDDDDDDNDQYKFGDKLKRSLIKMREMVMSTSMARSKRRSIRRRRKIGEEEQAAFLLMALSCGSVFA